MFAAIAFGVSSLEHVMNNMPAFIMSGLSASSSMMTGIGFAILLSMILNKEIGFHISFADPINVPIGIARASPVSTSAPVRIVYATAIILYQN